MVEIRVKTLNVKDPKAYRLAAAIAANTGKSLTRVVTEALEQHYQRVVNGQKRATIDELRAIAKRAADQVKGAYANHAELLYDESGIPR